MRIAMISITLLLAGIAFAAGPACGGHGGQATMLVTPDWLAAHLQDADLVVLAVGQKSEFEAGHIPGAQFLDLASISLRATAERPNSLELPPMADLGGAFGQLVV